MSTPRRRSSGGVRLSCTVSRMRMPRRLRACPARLSGAACARPTGDPRHDPNPPAQGEDRLRIRRIECGILIESELGLAWGGEADRTPAVCPTLPIISVVSPATPNPPCRRVMISAGRKASLYDRTAAPTLLLDSGYSAARRSEITTICAPAPCQGDNRFINRGNGIISRTCGRPVIHATVRSSPSPKPEWVNVP